MDYKVRISEEEYVFSITGSGPSLRVNRNGKSLPVDIREVGPDAYSLIVEGRAHLFTTERDAGGLTIRLDGRAYPAAVRRADADAEEPQDDDGGLRGGEREVRSVMPGIVTRLLVRAGDTVEVGAPLLVLEAMKMENEVRSHREGVIEKVHAKEGEAVDAGDLLLVLR